MHVASSPLTYLWFFGCNFGCICTQTKKMRTQTYTNDTQTNDWCFVLIGFWWGSGDMDLTLVPCEWIHLVPVENEVFSFVVHFRIEGTVHFFHEQCRTQPNSVSSYSIISRQNHWMRCECGALISCR